MARGQVGVPNETSLKTMLEKAAICRAQLDEDGASRVLETGLLESGASPDLHQLFEAALEPYAKEARENYADSWRSKTAN